MHHKTLRFGKGSTSFTLNFYVPPAYASSGDELPAGKPAGKGKPRRR